MTDYSADDSDRDAGADGLAETGTDAPVVYDLDPQCTASTLEPGERYSAVVNGVVDYGIFVDVSDNVSGLIHESELGETDFEVGDELVVRLLELKENGDIAFAPERLEEYQVVTVNHDPEITAIADVEIADQVTIEGELVQAKQTGGPTILNVADATGVIGCAAFEEAGVRAYPEISLGEMVRVSGTVEQHEGATQLEVDNVTALAGNAERTAREQLEASRAEQAAPADIAPLVEWDAMAKLRPELEELAQLLRRMVLEGRPIRVRHHADGDGMCAAIPLQQALENYIQEVYDSPDAPRHLFKRLPSKAPFYEMEDVTRDLNFALEGNQRYGQKFPLLLMLDNGSTEEDVPAYENLAHYDIPIAVVDHHHPDPEAVDPLLEAHINPYLHGEDYRVTTGMMCVELARLIDPDITDDLRHIPAVAGLSDRSKAEVMSEYIGLAEEAGYNNAHLEDIGEALDYAAHWLRYSDGQTIVRDVVDVACDDHERHRELVRFLSDLAERDVTRQIDAVEPHVTHETLDSGVHLHRIDLDRYAHRFTYPAPGKTTGKLHDRKVKEHGKPVITIGYGPDFAVLRSDGVRLDIPEMVAELNEEVPGGGVSGGGHLVVGSIKFVPGMRESVIDALVDKMASAELDAELSSATAIDD